MGLLNIANVKQADDRAKTRESEMSLTETIIDVQRKHLDRYDVFLSYSSDDLNFVKGIKEILEEKGLTVFVGAANNEVKKRPSVSRETANQLRTYMKKCWFMFYIHSYSSRYSRWCPWELGFFDGYSDSLRRLYVLPVMKSNENFVGQEYLNLYPIIEIDLIGTRESGGKNVWGRNLGTSKSSRSPISSCFP